jgi:NAD-dependent deacetylase
MAALPDVFDIELLVALRAARHVAVLTGAGVSAESGVPTFRDAQTGLWAKFRPEDLATSEAFAAHPKLVWEWYAWRRKTLESVRPNPGHYALAALAAKVPKLELFTQNVDGLHALAGSRDVVELHGNIHRSKCFVEHVVVGEWKETGEIPPRCPHCGAHLRPDVVWFGELLPPAALTRAEAAAAHCDVFFSIGTSAQVYPAAQLPVTALEHGATVIEVNPEPTPLTSLATFSLRGPSGVVLPRLMAAAWSEQEHRSTP